MSKQEQAYQIFQRCFSKKALRRIYTEKISQTHVVGTDGVSQSAFRRKTKEEINLIVAKVYSGDYRFTTFKQRLISKGPNRYPRVISIPTIRDRITLRALNEVLCEVFPDARLLRPHVFVKRIREALRKQFTDPKFIRVDVKDFYPTISHDHLFRLLRKKIRKKQILQLIKSALLTPTLGVSYDEVGVPQGLNISNILSSIYLHDLDRNFEGKYDYFRYVDDILVICDGQKADATFKEIVTAFDEVNLKCHPLTSSSKSKICNVSDGIEYLGFFFGPNRISVRRSSFTRMMENLLSVLTDYKHRPKPRRNETQLVWRLNLKITGCIYQGRRFGWIFFFSQINDLQQLGRLDQFLSDQLESRGLAHLRPRVKKFLRSYHEIRRNLAHTRYIPKFDDLNIDEIVTQLSCQMGIQESELRARHTEQELRQKFTAMIRRQTSMLERDLIEATAS